MPVPAQIVLPIAPVPPAGTGSGGDFHGHRLDRYELLPRRQVRLKITYAGLNEGGRPHDLRDLIIPTTKRDSLRLGRHPICVVPGGGRLRLHISGHYGLAIDETPWIGKNCRGPVASGLPAWLRDVEHVVGVETLVFTAARERFGFRAVVELLHLERPWSDMGAAPPDSLTSARAALIAVFDATIADLGRRLQAGLAQRLR
jgi:hypothetical protein